MPSAKSDAESLAALCIVERTRRSAAAKHLHDDVGPLISAAGLKLQLLQDDAAGVRAEIAEVLKVLEQAVERVRKTSRELNPSPAAQWGLKGALVSLETLHRGVSVTCSAKAKIPDAAVAALYEASAAAVAAAAKAGAKNVAVLASGAASVAVRVTDDGRHAGRARALSVAGLLARQAGVSITVATGKSTIVWIRYAARRSPRG